jgi:hypothetical protein
VGPFFFSSVISVLILVNPHPPHLTIGQFIFHRLIYLFDGCVGIGSVQMRNRPHNKGLTMSKMPPVATSGKLAKASKRKHACQELESEQRQHDRRKLFSSIGKNYAPAVVAPPLTPSGRNERYTTCIASAEKPHSVHLSVAGSTDSYVPGISEVAEKIVFDGDGGNSKLPQIAELVPIAKNVAGEEEESDEVSGSSGSSGGGERMRREHIGKVSAEAIAIVPVPKETNKALPDMRQTSAPPPR